MSTLRQLAPPLLVGVALLGLGGFLYVDQASELASAKPVEAVVDNSRVPLGSGDEGYDPIVAYHYEGNGTTYTSHDVFPGTGSYHTSRDRAVEIVQEYAPGDAVTAYVDPANPDRSFLIERRDTLVQYLMM